jgi:hypothetical protein
MRVREDLGPARLLPKLARLWELSAAKIRSLEESCPPGSPSPVYTLAGRYTARGWTEWTQGFQYGSAALQFDATGEPFFRDLCRERTLRTMAAHVTHTGVHDHGFNNVSTYGNLRRLAKEGRFQASDYEIHFYEMALKCSGAVQAARWTALPEGGFIHSFNGPHSLFVDTLRSLRALALSHGLGHVLMGEKDARISLLGRLLQHAQATAKYSVYYGKGRDAYDVRGRTAHESVFNVTDGSYRCPNSQQGFSPFTTWTRGLAWAMLGFAEELEFLAALPDSEFSEYGGRDAATAPLLDAALATCDYWIAATPSDGIPYWDDGAPHLHRLGDWKSKPADPFNSHEPVDSSAAAIACQGLMRLGRHLSTGEKYFQAGLTVLDRLLEEPYLGTDPKHQGLLLHSVYHRPNGWDAIPAGRSIPCGEACQWGDYHLREAGLLVQRLAENRPYLTFFGGA